MVVEVACTSDCPVPYQVADSTCRHEVNIRGSQHYKEYDYSSVGDDNQCNGTETANQ